MSRRMHRMTSQRTVCSSQCTEVERLQSEFSVNAEDACLAIHCPVGELERARHRKQGNGEADSERLHQRGRTESIEAGSIALLELKHTASMAVDGLAMLPVRGKRDGPAAACQQDARLLLQLQYRVLAFYSPMAMHLASTGTSTAVYFTGLQSRSTAVLNLVRVPDR